MSPRAGDDEPVNEQAPSRHGKNDDATALQHRIRQQEILAELGVVALQGASFDKLTGDTARLAAEGLHAEFCKVLEYLPSKNRFLVRAGVGWEPGIVGVATIGADLASPAGFALRTGKPVISNHLENEQRFRTPELLLEYGIHRAMNVILQGDRSPYGVLEVDSRYENEFVEQDLSFLQGAANILGMAIERERNEQSLKAALARQQVLLREVTHRVKNSLAIVASMLKLQAGEVQDAALTRVLEEASFRVSAVAKAHERIHYGSDAKRLDLGTYLTHVCEDVETSLPYSNVVVTAEPSIIILTDRAIPLALIVNELIMNAAKYAYEGQAAGKVEVRLVRLGNNEIELSLRDGGRGLPADFDLRRPSGLGMRIVQALCQQLDATLSVLRLDPGTVFTLSMAIEPRR
jgi:two-component sensor histidine kinase